MIEALRRSAAHVFVESLDTPILDPADLHHLGRVLRLRPGEVVSACDGRGSWRLCRFGRDEALQPCDDSVTPGPDGSNPSDSITIGFALPKGDRSEWVVEKVTEIGVDNIVILTAERSVTVWDDDQARRHVDKLRRVARAAAMQSRRLVLPQISGPTPARSMMRPGAAIAEPGGVAIGSTTVRTVLIGPEGGWTNGELAAAGERVDLGPTILRIDTAAVVASSRLDQARRS